MAIPRRSAALVALPLLVPLVTPPPQDEGDDVLWLSDGRIFDGLTLANAEGGVLVKYPSGDVFVAEELIEQALTKERPDFVPETDEERANYEKGLVPYDGKWITPSRRDALLRKRAAEARERVADAQTHREWGNRRTAESKHFDFHYTVPQDVFEEFEAKMEAYFTAFAKEWRVRQPRDQPKLRVNLYGSRKEFQRTAGAGPNTLGYFMFRGEYDLNVYYDRLDPELSEDVMFHEANHYLQQLVNVDFKYPHFPGESLAEYYGASGIDEDGELETGLLQEGRLTAVKNDIASGEWVGIRELIVERSYEHYTWGWSLVHFLMNDSRYEKKFKRFFVGLANDKKVDRYKMTAGAFMLDAVEPEEVLRYFMDQLGLKSATDLARLEDEWHEYVDGLENQSARGLELAALSAMRYDRPIRAKRLFGEAIAMGSESPTLFHKYGRLLWQEGEHASALEQLRKAVEIDPLNGEYWWDLGSAVYEEDKAEGKRLKALAREIDPEAGLGAWFF